MFISTYSLYLTFILFTTPVPNLQGLITDICLTYILLKLQCQIDRRIQTTPLLNWMTYLTYFIVSLMTHLHIALPAP